MPNSNDAPISIVVQLDLDSFNRSKSSLISELRALEGRTVNIGVSLDDAGIAGLQSRINDLDTTATVRVNASSGDLDTLNRQIADLDTTAEVRVNVADGDITEVERRVSGLRGESINVDVNANPATLDEIESKLENIQTLATISVVFDLASGAFDTVTGAFSSLADISGVSGIYETELAVQRLAATTGQVIPNAAETINDIYANNFGESRTQIADLIAFAEQAGVPIEDLGTAVTSALQVAGTFDQDPFEVLRAQSGLVSTGIVEDFNGAADLITTGFQDGLNVRDDFLDSLDEYATRFSDLGFTADQLLGFFSEGLGADIDNTDRLSDALGEFRIKAGEAASGASEDIANAYERLDLTDQLEAFTQGDITGAELLSQVYDAVSQLEDPLERSTILITLFGTQVEDFGAESFITALGGIGEKFENLGGSAQRASDIVSSTLPARFEQLRRLVEIGIGGALEDTFDITGFIDRLEGGITTFFDSLSSGESFGTSLGLGLEVAGLDELQNLLSDFLIGFLQGIREVVAVLPGANTGGLDSLISTLGTAQLEVDLAAANNAEDIEEAVTQAVDRGVNNETIFTNLADSFANADLGAQAAITNLFNNEDLQDQFGVIFAELSDYNFDGAINLDDAIQFATDYVAANNLAPELIDDLAQGLLVASQSQDIFGDALNAQFMDAVNNLDVQTALDLNELFPVDQQEANQGYINQIQGQLEYNLQEALDNFDIAGAQANFDLLGELATPEQAAAIEEYAQFLRDNFASTLANGDIAGAQDIVTLLGADDLQATLDDYIATLDVSDNPALTEAQSTLALGATAEELAANRDVISSELDGVTQNYSESFQAVKDANAELDAALVASTDYTSSLYNDLGTSVTSSTEGINDAFEATGIAGMLLGDTSEEAAKGFQEQWALALDGTSIAVALFQTQVADAVEGLGLFIQAGSSLSGSAAFGGIGGGGAGGNVTNNNTSINQYNYNNSGAAAANATAAVATGLTGG
ncbi:hypothetical protein KC887_02445 [Candidatus Kaiserbacteria bacterium]|nr:hypothetical protein [Candidatus Kaiserbacteria bacterium]